MDDTCFDLIPGLLTLTPNCNDRDTISTMSGNRGDDDEGGDDSESDGNSGDDEETVRAKLQNLEKRDRKRKQQMAHLQEQLKANKQARQGSVIGKKRVTQIKDLDDANKLPLDKQISLNNYFRDHVFRGLKYVTKDVLKSKVAVEGIMQHLRIITEYDIKRYRVHIELAL